VKVLGLGKYYILLICGFLTLLGVLMSIVCVTDPLQEIAGGIVVAFFQVLSILILRLNWKKFTTSVHCLIILLILLNTFLILYSLFYVRTHYADYLLIR
jgi:hypothetical protein